VLKDQTVEEQWIKAGIRLINEIGAEAYLRLLLDHLRPE
jgi:hypothetical protein